MSIGYSKTPLWKKLGYKENYFVSIINPYADYYNDLNLPFDVYFVDNISPAENHSIDLIHYFHHSRDSLQDFLLGTTTKLRYNGSLWILWPKKVSKVPTDLDENIVRKIGLASGLVDVKVAAINLTWSGLKFMYRKVDRKL